MRHSHEYVFHPVSEMFVCSCGDRTDDLETALRRQRTSRRALFRRRRIMYALFVAAAIDLMLLFSIAALVCTAVM